MYLCTLWGFKSTIVYFKGPHYCDFDMTRGSTKYYEAYMRLIFHLAHHICKTDALLVQYC